MSGSVSSKRSGGNSLILCLDVANNKSYKTTSGWSDLSGSSNDDAVISNSPTYDKSNGGSLTFNGTNNYVELPNTSQTKLTGLKQVTIDVWVSPSSFSGTGNRYIYAQFYTGGNTSCGIYLTTGGNFVFGYRDNVQNNSGLLKTLTSTSTLSINKIYNLVATFDAGVATKLYINGVLDNTSVQTNNISSVNPDFIRVSKLDSLTSDFYSGKIYSVSVYKTTLSASDVSKNYSSNKRKFGLN